MNELISRVVDRAGISEESAIQAVDVMLSYLKERLPPPITAQIQNYLGDDAAASAMQGAKGAIGRMFGKDKE